MEMSKRLLLARKKLGESQADFAKGIGMKQGSYSDFERGRRDNFSESTLMLLEINFGISREWLLNGVGEMFLSPPEKDIDTEKLLRTIEEQRKEIERLTELINKIKALIS